MDLVMQGSSFEEPAATHNSPFAGDAVAVTPDLFGKQHSPVRLGAVGQRHGAVVHEGVHRGDGQLAALRLQAREGEGRSENGASVERWRQIEGWQPVVATRELRTGCSSH